MRAPVGSASSYAALANPIHAELWVAGPGSAWLALPHFHSATDFFASPASSLEGEVGPGGVRFFTLHGTGKRSGSWRLGSTGCRLGRKFWLDGVLADQMALFVVQQLRSGSSRGPGGGRAAPLPPTPGPRPKGRSGKSSKQE